MHKLLRLVLFAGLVLPGARASSQFHNDKPKFDCGTVTSRGSGSWTYEDFGYGFRFELPSSWIGGQNSIHEPSGPRSFLVEALFAASDPKLHPSEGARRGPTETINGLDWTALTWPDGGIGSYTYRDGVMVEFVAGPIRIGSDSSVPPESLAALKQIQSSFTFFDDPYRLDRQLAALKVGQKLGGLTITRIVPGAGGFDHPMMTVEFAGQLTLTGHVVLPSPTMGGGWSGYFMADLDSESRSVVPQLKCPVEGLDRVTEWTFGVGFTNQQFTNQQFAQVPSISGNHAWYDAEATVVVGNVSTVFGNGGMNPGISARLLKVIRKKETQ